MDMTTRQGLTFALGSYSLVKQTGTDNPTLHTTSPPPPSNVTYGNCEPSAVPGTGFLVQLPNGSGSIERIRLGIRFLIPRRGKHPAIVFFIFLGLRPFCVCDLP